MAVSRSIRDRARDAIIGMTHEQAMEATGLQRSTFYQLINGHIVGDDKYIKFAHGVKDDPEWYLAEKRRIVGVSNPFDLLAHVLSKELHLPAEVCRQIMRQARDHYPAERENDSQDEAA